MADATRACKWCDGSLEHRGPKAVYCSQRCKNAATKAKLGAEGKLPERPTRTGVCRVCGRTWTERSARGRMRETCPECWATNKARTSETWRKRDRTANPDKWMAAGRRAHALRWSDPVRRSADMQRMRRYAVENPDVVRAISAAWSRRNPEKGADYAARRRSRIRGARRDEPVDFAAICERDNWVCQICWKPVDPAARYPDGRAATRDHIVPLLHGGDHAGANLQLAHATCNKRKGARLDFRLVD